MPDLFEPDVELRWRGKETKVKTVSLPFQTVEYISSKGVRAMASLVGLRRHLKFIRFAHDRIERTVKSQSR